MQLATQMKPNTLLTIDESAYFETVKRQLKYYPVDAETGEEIPEDEYVNRYALVRKDTGKLLGIHSDDYIVRPVSYTHLRAHET